MESKEQDPAERGAERGSSPPATSRASPHRPAGPGGTPRPGRWDRGGVCGKLGGREAGPAGRQRRPMGSAEHDVTALITAWLWLTKRTMRLPSSPLPPRKKMPPSPSPRSPLPRERGAAAGARARPGCQSPARPKRPGAPAAPQPRCPAPPGFLRAAAPFPPPRVFLLRNPPPRGLLSGLGGVSLKGKLWFGAISAFPETKPTPGTPTPGEGWG